MAKNDKKNNESSNSQEGEKKSKAKTQIKNKPLLGALVVIGLIALAAIGVGAYSLINSNSEGTEQSSENGVSSTSTDSGENGEDSNGDESSDSSSSSDSNDSSSSNNNESSSSDSSSDDSDSSDSNSAVGASGFVQSGHSAAGYQKSLANQAAIAASGVWTATDYVQGDIVGPEYTVQTGDTLWEISEGLYGTGFRWTEILNKNEGKVGTLPNGERALILPGIMLNLE